MFSSTCSSSLRLLGWLSAMKAGWRPRLQNDAARGVVHDLPRDGEELELYFEVSGAEYQRQGVEEQGAVVGSVQRHQMAAQVRLDPLVERAQIGRLPREAGAVIDDLQRQLSLSGVELHSSPCRRDGQRATAASQALRQMRVSEEIRPSRDRNDLELALQGRTEARPAPALSLRNTDQFSRQLAAAVWPSRRQGERVQFNTAQRELTLKIVYYGPASREDDQFARALPADPAAPARHLMTLDTADDRTLFSTPCLCIPRRKPQSKAQALHRPGAGHAQLHAPASFCRARTPSPSSPTASRASARRTTSTG